MTPTDRVSDKTIWEPTEAAEYNVNYLYSYLIDIVNAEQYLGLTESLTDMLKYGSYNYNAFCYIPSEMSYGGTIITPGYVGTYLGFWGTMDTAILHFHPERGQLLKIDNINNDNYNHKPDERYIDELYIGVPEIWFQEKDKAKGRTILKNIFDKIKYKNKIYYSIG